MKLRDKLTMGVEIYRCDECDYKYNSISCDHNNKNVLWTSPELYEFIKNNPDEIIVEAQCRPPIILKTVGVKE